MEPGERLVVARVRAGFHPPDGHRSRAEPTVSEFLPALEMPASLNRNSWIQFIIEWNPPDRTNYVNGLPWARGSKFLASPPTRELWVKQASRHLCSFQFQDRIQTNLDWCSIKWRFKSWLSEKKKNKPLVYS